MHPVSSLSALLVSLSMLSARDAAAQAPVAPPPPATALPPAAVPPATEDTVPPVAAPAEAPALQPSEAPPATVAPAPVEAPPPPVLPPPAAQLAPAPSEPAAATAAKPPGGAPEFLPLKVAGSFWSRYELRSNYKEHGLTHPRLHREGDYVVSRARLMLATTPVDVGGDVRVSARFVPQAVYTWGENLGSTPTVSDHPGLALYEGYASVGSKHYQLDAGRFAMDYGDAVVIGNLGWNEAARAFNGGRLRVTPTETPFYVDLFATLVNEGRLLSSEPISGDSYFYGIYAGLGPLVQKDFDLDVYLLGQTIEKNDTFSVVDPADSTNTAVGKQKAATEMTLGARLKGKVSMLDYRGEVGVQFGKKSPVPTFGAPLPRTRSKFAYQLDGELGVSPVKGLRVGLEGLVASGDDATTADKDEGWNELYPTAHKFLGFADIVGPRTNVVSGVLHLSYKPVEALAFSVDAHYFSRPQAAGADRKDGAIGEEIDVNVLYAIGKGASVRAMYALFLPNEDFWQAKSQTPGDASSAMHYFELQFGYDFK